MGDGCGYWLPGEAGGFPPPHAEANAPNPAPRPNTNTKRVSHIRDGNTARWPAPTSAERCRTGYSSPFAPVGPPCHTLPSAFVAGEELRRRRALVIDSAASP